MSIKILCDCGGKFKINADMFGKRVQCPSCGQALIAFAPGDQGDTVGGAEKPAVHTSTPEIPPEKARKALVFGGIGTVALAAIGIACYLLIAGNPFGREKGPDAEKPGPIGARSKRSTGFLEVVNSRQIVGWAWDPEQPDTPIQVDVYDNDRLLVTVPADQFRKDLAKFGNGKHRFLYTIPNKMRDDKEHVIRAKISGTKIELRNSPKTVTLTAK
jgi:hypothetical protein